MKKTMIVAIICCFLAGTSVPAAAGGHRHHPPGGHHVVHHHAVHHHAVVHHHPVYHHPPGHVSVHHHYDNDWEEVALGVGVGIVAGSLVRSLWFPPRAPVCAAPAPVVVTTPPAVIVQQPVTVVTPAYASSGSVTVTASTLNVRLGPGAEHAVVGQVHQGTVLTVHGSSGEWIYVRMPSGAFGWVLAQYTVTFQPPACG